MPYLRHPEWSAFVTDTYGLPNAPPPESPMSLFAICGRPQNNPKMVCKSHRGKKLPEATAAAFLGDWPAWPQEKFLNSEFQSDSICASGSDTVALARLMRQFQGWARGGEEIWWLPEFERKCTLQIGAMKMKWLPGCNIWPRSFYSHFTHTLYEYTATQFWAWQSTKP